MLSSTLEVDSEFKYKIVSYTHDPMQVEEKETNIL